ncbi:CRISPR-associated endonuclease Cas1 [Ectothiorhodospira haloalkaliphila]|uniref:CRISPR-associated endonuclease Cas1 n=1 Tax=Ectothiorhodospira haloalkaliphila TaxID=421628 RepID=UPI001EE9A366|nr:CRISPR-associated endonuclease Cas1 [Ectothiorhodospira haloalkaliphila]MCG5525864.1 CRISPR-associated endonuclease Cas1 [Ectothiorhodospira haloalkaliphila]
MNQTLTPHWSTPLLPFRGLGFTLAFTEATPARSWIEPALTAFMRSLLEHPADFDQFMGLRIDHVPEGDTWPSGATLGAALIALPGGEALLERAIERLQALPDSAPRLDRRLPLRDNLRCEAVFDAFTRSPVRSAAELIPKDAAGLDHEVQALARQPVVRVCFFSPVRLLLPKSQRGKARGEARYCNDATQLTPGLLFARLHDTMADLLRRHGHKTPPRTDPGAIEGEVLEARWIDHGYRNGAGREQPMGGLLATLELQPSRLTPELLRLLILGWYLGLGQRRSFGWGRYRLENEHGKDLTWHDNAPEIRETHAHTTQGPGSHAKDEQNNPVKTETAAEQADYAEDIEVGAAPMALGQAAADGTQLLLAGEPARLGLEGGRLRVERREGEALYTPLETLAGVTLLGPHQVTTQLLGALLDRGIPLALATGQGRLRGVLWNGVPGEPGPGLWLRQIECFEDEQRTLIAARAVVDARLRQQREVLRNRMPPERYDDLHSGFNQLIARVAVAEGRASLNGLEGQAARLYFGALAELLPTDMEFSGRNRRPPRDPFNVLLSLGYSVLHAHVDTVVRLAGLYPWRGFYHQSHGLHPALASDLMEPFRHLVERAALNAISRGRIRATDFDKENNACRMDAAARRRYLADLSQRLLTPVRARGETEAKGLHDHLHRQTRSLIAWIREESPAFEPFRTR